MKYDLYITNESRLSSPNANMVFKLGVFSVVLTVLITLITWLDYNGVVLGMEWGGTISSDSEIEIITKAPFFQIKYDTVKLLMKCTHFVLLAFALFYYWRANKHNESSWWVALGLVLIISTTIHTYSIGEFYSIESGPIDKARIMLENRVNKL